MMSNKHVCTDVLTVKFVIQTKWCPESKTKTQTLKTGDKIFISTVKLASPGNF